LQNILILGQVIHIPYLLKRNKMKFNEYRTIHDATRKLLGLPAWEVYYKREILETLAEIIGKNPESSFTQDRLTTFSQLSSERFWYRKGRPYYNINPSLIETFSKCSIDIPASLIKFPFQSFSINFPSPEDGNTLIVDKDHYVKSILCHMSNSHTIQETVKSLGIPMDLYRQDNRIILWVDIGETYNYGTAKLPVYTYRQLAYSKGDTVDESLHKLAVYPDGQEGIFVPPELTEQCVRLMISLCFLVDAGDSLVLPDLLAKHREKLEEDDFEVIKEYHLKAKEKGKFGWTIGMGPKSHMTFSHVRQGHWHKVLYGPKKSKTKIIWYRPTTVRPDLPKKE